MAVVILLSVCLYFKSPKTIEVTGDALILHKAGGNMVMPFLDIQEIRRYSKSGIRLFGIGGVFGFFGLFTNSEIGRHHAYVESYYEAFLVVRKSGKKYVLSCEDRDELVRIVSENLAKHSDRD